MALTKKAIAYLGLTFAFIGLALALSEPSFLVFVVPMSVLLYLSPSLTPVRSLRLQITRRIHPSRSFGGEDVEVMVKVTNDSNEKIVHIHLEEQVPQPLILKSGTRTVAGSMNPGEEFEYCYRISAPKRGRYILGPFTARTSDLMGFRADTDQVNVFDNLTVLPRIEKTGPVELRARRVGPWPGLIASRKIGLGTEFFELEPYAPGDDLRRINWKASAKLGQLVTNEFEGEQVTDVLLVLDSSQDALPELFGFDALEFEVNLAASLCSQLILQGNRVGLSIYGPVRTWVEPAFGKRQLLRLLDNLAIVKPGRPTVPMDYAVQSVIVSVVPARSVIVVISPLLGDEIANVVLNLAARGYSIVCFTPAPSPNHETVSQSRVLARRIVAAERRMKMIELTKVAKLIETSPDLAIRSMLRRRAPWRAI
jgi:uncharacterized protein (DUF58 family)